MSGGPPVICNDNNDCTTDSCVPMTGCVYDFNTNPCNDGQFCTVGDMCNLGACVGGAARDCSDGNACTTDVCDEDLDQCVYTTSGACDITGTVYYYRNDAGNGAGSEPSAKPVPNVGIDDTNDTTADAVTDDSGAYALNDLSGNVTVRTLPKFGTPRASDHNNAVTSFDSVLIARHAVHLTTLSGKQQVAGDVSGNNVVTAYDAGLVAQFAVSLINHLPVATSTGSDWKFFRCDTLSNPLGTCADPVYTYTPLSGAQVANFYGVLYGDVSGSWVKASPLAGTSTSPEDDAAAQDTVAAAKLAGTDLHKLPPSRTKPLTMFVEDRTASSKGTRQHVVYLNVKDSDGVQGLDLSLDYDASKLQVMDVRAVDSSYSVIWNDMGGSVKIAFYGAVPLQGDGRIVAVTLETKSAGKRTPLRLTADANEGLIPVQIVNAPKQGKVIESKLHALPLGSE